MTTPQTTPVQFDEIDVNNLDIEGLEVVTMKDALALPETGASSGISSATASSTCGSSSTCSSSRAVSV